jgi:NADH-quinone oxidoreductase subunit A
MTDLVAFSAVHSAGVVFLLLPLVLGLFVRPTNPTPQKLSAYECGEPTIGSSYIQFDLRFYVVALLFIIFDVEVAFFFRGRQFTAGPPNCLIPGFPNRPACSSAKNCSAIRPGRSPRTTLFAATLTACC